MTAAQGAIDRLSHPAATVQRWSVLSRIAFRFGFVYFSLYLFATQLLFGLLPIPDLDLDGLFMFVPVRAMVFWTARHVFGVSAPLVYTGSGSGDKTYDWVLSFCFFCLASATCIAWSILDRRRGNYRTMFKWFHLVLRFVVGSVMISYGMLKLVPLQMPFPFLTKLVEPFGDFSPMGVLWFSVGAAPSYEMFVGAAETLGGILLFFPRTSLLGALLCLADTVEIFTLNMTYDVPVKLFSFHLIVMCLFLLAPEMTRLLHFFFSDRAVSPSSGARLFQSVKMNRVAFWMQALLAVSLIASNIYGAWNSWHIYGGGAPKSPLYGIWNVDELRTDGELRPALASNGEQWRRLIFERPNGMAFQTMNAAIVPFRCSINSKDNRLTLIRNGNDSWRAEFSYRRQGNDHMSLDGEMDGKRLHLELTLVDRSKFLLVSRGFHWVQEYPFNR